MYFLRFTKEVVTKDSKSYDHFTGSPFNGVCCFDVTEYIEDEDKSDCFQAVKSVIQKDNTYFNNEDGNFVVFSGYKTRDNPYGNGVIAKPADIIYRGQAKFFERSWGENLELV